MLSRQYIEESEITYQKQIKELRDKVKFFINKSQRLEKENKQLKKDIKHLVNIINHNCLVLDITDEESEALERWNK